MSVEFYDEAVKAKLQAVFSNTEYQSRDLLFKTVTDRNGEVTFPLIGIFRPDGWSISSSNSWILNKEFLKNLRQVYVDLNYQIDIYANTRKDLEELTSEVVMYLLRNPGVVVTYKSADGKKETSVKSNLTYVSGPERTSEIDDTTVGRVYRYTLVFALTSAAIYNFVPDDLKPGDDEYVPLVSQVIVEVKPEVIEIEVKGKTKKTIYISKEDVKK